MEVGTPAGPAARAYDVLTVGETLVAIRTGGPLAIGAAATLSVAGAESNVAIGLSRLGHTTRWVGVVGDDEPGELILRTLRAEAVDVSAARVDSRGPTGLLLAEPRIAGLTRIRYYRTGSAGSQLRPADVHPHPGPAPRLLHVTGITPALGPDPRQAIIDAVTTARESGASVCLDVNYRSRLWSREQAAAALGALVRQVDIAVASEDELGLLGPDSLHDPDAPEEVRVQALLEAGMREVVVKRGAAGATAYTREGKVSAPAHPIPVVDVIGAGDGFVAGYLSAWLDGGDVAARLQRATATAAFVVASPGDWEGLPRRDELRLLDAPRSTILR